MKRPLFIIIGTILVIVLLVIWLYVLFYGSPENSPDNFSLFNFKDTTDLNIDTATTTNQENPLVDTTGNEPLRQLTTKPVAGRQELNSENSSTTLVMFIEAGTGHIFQIDLVTGEEKRVSGTTIQKTWAGAITPDGQYALIQSGLGNSRKYFMGKIDQAGTAFENKEFTGSIISFRATTENTFIYAVQNNSSVVVKQYFPISDLSEDLFTIPYREATIAWGNTANGPHFIYPKVNSKLEGFVLEAREKNLRRLPADGLGLSAVGNGEYLLYSVQEDNQYKTYIQKISSGEEYVLSEYIIPQKCSSFIGQNHMFLCGIELYDQDSKIEDEWHKGKKRFVDDLWLFYPSGQYMVNLISIEPATGRTIDLEKPELNKEESRFYFINKNDQTLWLFELPSNISIDNNNPDL